MNQSHSFTPKNKSLAFHSHDFYEVYYFVSGNASVCIEESAYRMKPCDVAIFPANIMHRAVFHDTDAMYERLLIYM